MKAVLQYIRFFIYTTSHWNIALAFFMLYYDIRGAFRYGIRKTFAPVELRHLTLRNADLSKSSPYEAVSFYMLEKLLTAFRRISDSSSLVDLGCGKGRVLIVAAHFGFKRITGIDFAKELCSEASLNMKEMKTVFADVRWQVIHANVLEYEIQPGDSVFFLFNPFAEETLILFLKKLEHSCESFPRQTWFIYASPQHAAALENRGYKTVFHQQMMNLKGDILFKESTNQEV